MKKILFLLLFCASILRGQQSPIFMMYRDQNSLLNPAMPSTNYLINEYNNSISATYHYQFIGVPDAPITQALTWECLPRDKNILIGVTLFNDKMGAIGTMGLRGQFAYKMELSKFENRILTIGLSGGAQRFRANLTDIAAERGITLGSEDYKAHFLPDLNMGVFYNEGKVFYVGLSTSQLLNTTVQLRQTINASETIRKPREVYAMGGMYIDAPFFGNDGAYLEPAVWLRYVPNNPKALTFDVNLRAKISNSFWVGTGFNAFSRSLSIETGSILGESIGLDGSQVKIGLSFGFPISSTVTGFGPNGEVHLSYSWGN